ncbi:(2Fe-2S) ferredoxin domain-containing protein [Rubrimonas cliftonensis]|uniref:(2Fe-2S) ferredoxin n=1 Tax=Rubrimonas cliftonensis TaxID=89524 RepID=A0A1H4G8T6_9RHOB|nr:(2Fe-2S) ferredoxin domain-containing protein [Rubrimonas cliftonensis]SEB05984.1 (2Fe-2S) ferredoxin [Rubrimonas cliftonensis]
MSTDDNRLAGRLRHGAQASPATGILLVARAAVAAAPVAEMAQWAALARQRHPAARVAFGFVGQGAPSVRAALADLRAEGAHEVLIVPLMLPFEPSLRNSLGRMIARWRATDPAPWPSIRLGTGWAPHTAAPSGLLDCLVAAAAGAEPLSVDTAKPEGSLVPAQHHRVLLCAGGPCTQAGALILWQHLRARQDEWKLRQEGAGMMSCRTTCLGPCALAPVMQVWPDGATYGGLDETGTDAVLRGHVLGGQPVDALRYEPTGRKQRLRGEDGPAQ